MTSVIQAAHRPGRWAACALLTFVLAGCGAAATPAADEAAAPPAPFTPAQVDPALPGGALLHAPTPLRVKLPRLKIDAGLVPLQLDAARVLVPPPYGRAGWYKAGPEPGELGRAVIAGHVDSKTGPDVFAALHNARRGDRVLIRLADGSALTFTVYAIEVHPLDDFPTKRVYGKDKRSELRLITCTGPYDKARGGYQDNLVVFARLMT